jgi:superfamily II DNA helicase RecQ
MVEDRPRTEDALLEISGVGARKAADLGAVFLAEIAAFMEESTAKMEADA